MLVEFDNGVLLERLALHKRVQRCTENSYKENNSGVLRLVITNHSQGVANCKRL